MSNALETPNQSSYDVVIVGGAMFGSSVAWFLTDNPDFDGSILVVEKDPTYEFTSTSHTNSCMRQQFSREINVRVSQFAAKFVKNFQDFMGNDSRVPKLPFHCYGYMYLADNEAFADVLRESQKLQVTCGAGTKFMSPAEIIRFISWTILSVQTTTSSMKAILTATHCLTGGSVLHAKEVQNISPMKSSP